jgi:hypothetical protein
MHFPSLVCLAVYASSAYAAITWTVVKAQNPTADQTDAYARMSLAMQRASARYAQHSNLTKTVRVKYVPSVRTADANYNGEMRFGANRIYMNERVALHEISHTVGVGQTRNFNKLCTSGDWKTALPLLKSWNGPNAKIKCDGNHFWPYGLLYDQEWSETNANRHVQIVQAMVNDGM